MSSPWFYFLLLEFVWISVRCESIFFLNGNGFHKSLFVNASVEAPYLLILNVTSEWYINMEEVTLLGVQILSDDMDIEGTAEQSTNHMVHVYFNRTTITIPVHMRYQPPCPYGYVTVQHSTPVLLTLTNTSTIVLPCNAHNDLLCKWKKLTLNSRGGGTTNVPCGLWYHCTLVAVATVVTSFFSVIKIIRYMHNGIKICSTKK